MHLEERKEVARNRNRKDYGKTGRSGNFSSIKYSKWKKC
jgi:hypothetical protein